MASEEMLIVLRLMELIQKKGSYPRLSQKSMGFLTSEELSTLQAIAGREGGIGQVMETLLTILSMSEEHFDLSTKLMELSAFFLVWSLEAIQPLEESEWTIGQRVRVRFPGEGLVYIGKIVENDCVFIPMLGDTVHLSEVHIQERVLPPKPTAVDVAAFQKTLQGQLEAILQQSQTS